jgi:hypothetical protein
MSYADALARISQIQSLIGTTSVQRTAAPSTSTAPSTSSTAVTSSDTTAFQSALNAALSNANGNTSSALKDALKNLGKNGAATSAPISSSTSADSSPSTSSTGSTTSVTGLANAPTTRAEAITRSQEFAGKATALTPQQLKGVLARQGFSGEGLHVAWALAMRESGGQPGAIGRVNSNGTRDHGLFQVNDIHLGRSLDPSVMYDPDSNAAAAFKMSSRGTNFSAWAIGTSGWAGHLMRTMPTTYAQLNAAYQKWYDRYPG